ncbi:FkbM family methyltransferase [Variovorax sp. LG9.2]|uniref:FkbM family methyltransferase n=1 Tax=Variovorax sp. LG9.2 TaxID=3048626 RepID=UPI002B23B7AC|nr:FkbM family methyltransferase [Variovorax sp. LG9.2]MEB0059033.1 FkbM family methyltransferase [Variovorax sp. LG9.2]
MNIWILLKFAKRWLAKRQHRHYLVGTHRITLPPGHRLDEYQQAFLNYDRKLPVIARLVDSKYSGMVTLDIGANIGDSAVAIRSTVSGPILCVEGNSAFLPYLHANLLPLPGINRVIPTFIRPSGADDVDFEVLTTGGTAHLMPRRTAMREHRTSRMTTVQEILEKNADLGPVKLLKTDTDGFDFAILLGALDSLALDMPILFFEFDPLIGNSNPSDAVAAVEGLGGIGYRSVVVYDNYGNYLMGSDLTRALAQDLVANVMQRHRAGGGAVYFDFCCFSIADADIFQALVQYEREGIRAS